jgi:hypothetical protein
LNLFKQIFFEECEDFKLLLTLYDCFTFDHGGVKKRRIAIGVAMGYRVVSSNPGFDVHPFLRSWIAERAALVVGNRQQCIGIAMLGSQTTQPLLAFGINLDVSCKIQSWSFRIQTSVHAGSRFLCDSWMCYNSRSVLKRIWGRYTGMRTHRFMVILSDRGCKSITDRRCSLLLHEDWIGSC